MRESICERRRSGVPSYYFTFPQNDASEHVILSAAGAKDLLFVSAAPQQVHRARSPLMRDATASRSFARARAARFRPHPLSPSPHTRRGGTKGESRVPPLHICGEGGEDHGETD